MNSPFYCINYNRKHSINYTYILKLQQLSLHVKHIAAVVMLCLYVVPLFCSFSHD